jgi:predicted nucleotidyltransferase
MDRLILDHREQILRAASAHGARRVRVFGSHATGHATAASDIDLLVDMAPDRSLLDRIALIDELESLLGRSVDVVNEHALHAAIRDRVLASALPL